MALVSAGPRACPIVERTARTGRPYGQRLFRSQRRHRRHAHGPERRHDATRQRYDERKTHADGEGHGIARRNAEEQRTHPATARIRAQHARDDADCREAHPVGEDHSADARAVRAQREADADLLRPL